MKKIIIFAIAILAVLAISCNKYQFYDAQDNNSVQISFIYTLSTENGNYMGTKKTNAEVFDVFYQRIASGELVAPSYDLVFIEKTSGVKYEFTGEWGKKDLVTLRKGTYTVTGKSTAVGNNIQDKCSLSINDEIIVDGTETEVSLYATYDCSLIIFSDASLASLSNYNGEETDPLFKYNNYLYAFVATTLYKESYASTAYLIGKHTDNTEFKIFTGKLIYEKGKYYIYNDVKTTFQLGEMEEGGSEEGGSDGNAINLSANGTANSYIVNAAGKYYFNASVKGNGTESVGTPSTAETIWESFNSSTAPNVGDIINDVQFNNGIVSFTATGKEGNALIAVKNSSGTILWSWHIWTTKYNPDTEYDTYKNYSNIKVMNRNLGALSSTAGDYRSLGFYYQWGRKDPLPSSSSISSYVMMSTTPSSVFNTVSNSSSVGTISYAVQHPTTAIKESSNLDWMYSPNSSLWSTKKTQYDPCPKGWKVPDISLYSSFTSTSDYSRDKTNKGVKFGTSVSTPGAFFPCCGTIGGGDLSGGAGEFAISCHYWSNSGSRFCIYKSSAPSTSYNTFRSHGFPVRCCAE